MSYREQIHSYVAHLRIGFQDARADLFVRLLQPATGWRVLDLGGNRGQFSELLKKRVDVSVTVADPIDFAAECAAKGFSFVKLDENRPLPFSTQEFDVVVSNSVIEHVTLPKAECLRTDISEEEWESRASARQSEFAAEIRRVGRGYFVQTPHKGFPLELHTWMPFVGRLSHRSTVRLTAVTDRFWIKRAEVADWRLLNTAEMRQLFPDGEVEVERAFGMAKSIVAYRLPDHARRSPR